MARPYGWTPEYERRWTSNQVELLLQRVSDLEAQVKRLEAQKADRKGRKPIVQGKVHANSERSPS